MASLQEAREPETVSKEPGGPRRGAPARLKPGPISGPRVARSQEASGSRSDPRRDVGSGPEAESLPCLGHLDASCARATSAINGPGIHTTVSWPETRCNRRTYRVQYIWDTTRNS